MLAECAYCASRPYRMCSDCGAYLCDYHGRMHDGIVLCLKCARKRREPA